MEAQKFYRTQVVYNLVRNALKYTKKGLVQLTVWEEGSRIYFEVKDEGIGISKDKIDEIFKPFFQEKRNKEN